MWLELTHSALSLANELVIIALCVALLVQVSNLRLQLRRLIRQRRRHPEWEPDGEPDD